MLKRLCGLMFIIGLFVLTGSQSLAQGTGSWAAQKQAFTQRQIALGESVPSAEEWAAVEAFIAVFFNQINGHWGEAPLVSSDYDPSQSGDVQANNYTLYTDTHECTRHVSAISQDVSMSVTVKKFTEDGIRYFYSVQKVTPNLPDTVSAGGAYELRHDKNSNRTWGRIHDGQRRLEYGTHGRYILYYNGQYVGPRDYHFSCHANA